MDRHPAVAWLDSASERAIFLLARIASADDGVPLEELRSGDLGRDLARSCDLIELVDQALVETTASKRVVPTFNGQLVVRVLTRRRQPRVQ